MTISHSFVLGFASSCFPTRHPPILGHTHYLSLGRGWSHDLSLCITHQCIQVNEYSQLVDRDSAAGLIQWFGKQLEVKLPDLSLIDMSQRYFNGALKTVSNSKTVTGSGRWPWLIPIHWEYWPIPRLNCVIQDLKQHNFYPIIISYGTGSILIIPHPLLNAPIHLGKTQEELTVKKGDAMAFCGVLGFAMVIFYAVQQVLPREKLWNGCCRSAGSPGEMKH